MGLVCGIQKRHDLAFEHIKGDSQGIFLCLVAQLLVHVAARDAGSQQKIQIENIPGLDFAPGGQGPDLLLKRGTGRVVAGQDRRQAIGANQQGIDGVERGFRVHSPA